MLTGLVLSALCTSQQLIVIKKTPVEFPRGFWLRWQDLNLRIPGPKPGALPLGYTPAIGGGGRIRTCEGDSRQIYSLLPLATREPLRIYGDPTGIRTRVTAVKGRCLKPLDHGALLDILVGMEGFEPPASCSQGKRASQAALHPVISNARFIIPKMNRSVKRPCYEIFAILT